MKITANAKKTAILIGFILLKFFLQYLLHNPGYDLQRDEYLHLDQANHLAWGFESVPPVSSWVGYLIQLLGNGVFWVRFFPAVFGALTLLLVWKTIELLQGNLFALILGASSVVFSTLVRLNFLFQPNSLDVLCWTAVYFVLIKYIISQQVKWLFVGAVVFALGFLNKYNIAFLMVGLLPAVLLTEQRNVFAKKEFYYAMALGLVLITPNLLWQYQHNFPVLHHLKILAATQLVNVNRADFLKEQLLYFLGALPVLIAALYALLFHPPFKRFRLFFASIIFTLAVFVYLKAKGYYAIGLYPIYLSFGAVFLGSKLNTRVGHYLQVLLVAIPLALYVWLFPLVFSVKDPRYYITHADKFRALGMLRWEDGKEHPLPQDFADMQGWKELANKVEALYNQLPNKEQTIIVCDNYGQAGAINYYSRSKNIKAVSFNADYINWFNLDDSTQHFIRVKEFDGSSEELAETSKYFETGRVAGSITNIYAREYQTTIFVFSRPKTSVNGLLKAEIAERKKRD